MVNKSAPLETITPSSELDFVLSKSIAHNRYAKSGSGGALLSKNGTLLFVTEELLTLIELAPNEVVGKNISDFMGEDNAEKYFFSKVDNLFQAKLPQLSCVVPWKVKGKQEVLLSLDIYPPLPNRDELACYAKVCVPEKIIEKKLADHNYLENIVRNINAVVWLRTTDARRYLYISPNCKKVFGLTVDEYHENPEIFFSRIHPDDKERLITEYFGSDKETPYRYRMDDNTWKHFTAYRFFIENQDGLPALTAGITIDDTNLYNAQQEILHQKMRLKKKNLELKSANKMLEDFTALACHDLSQPLRVFTSYMSILHDDYFQDVDHEGQKIFDALFKATKRMKSLLQGMADVYLTQHVRKNIEPLTPSIVLDDVLELYYLSKHQYNINVEKGRLYPVKVDEGHLTALFKNLIENAIKYNINPPRIKIWSKKLRSGIVYAIKDNGIGIPQVAQQQIFKVGYRFPSVTPQDGMGIGLSACEKIMGIYKGKIWVHSKVGEGATFYLFFPGEAKDM